MPIVTLVEMILALPIVVFASANVAFTLTSMGLWLAERMMSYSSALNGTKNTDNDTNRPRKFRASNSQNNNKNKPLILRACVLFKTFPNRIPDGSEQPIKQDIHANTDSSPFQAYIKDNSPRWFQCLNKGLLAICRHASNYRKRNTDASTKREPNQAASS